VTFSSPSTRRETVPRWARVVDLTAIGLSILALFIAINGGFVMLMGSVRLSVRSEWRLLLWAATLLLVRHAVLRRPRIDTWIVGDIAAAARQAGPLAVDAVRRPRHVRAEPLTFWQRPLVRAMLVIGLYAVLTVVMTYPQVRHLGRGIVVEFGDQFFSIWRLAWVAHQLPRDPRHLFDANIFFPESHTLAFSDAMIVPGVVAAPLAWVGIHPITIYHLVFLSGFALSGAAMFLLVRSLTQHTFAAFVAGFIFAFLPYRFMHYTHLELQMTMWMPLCLWAFHRAVQEERLAFGLLTGLLLALQTLSSWYYGIFLATYLLPVGAVLLIGEGSRRLGPSIRVLIAGGLLAAVIVGPLTRPYFEARRAVGERGVDEIGFYSATPFNYLAAHPRNVTFGALTSKWGGQERELFQGFAVLLLALVGVWPPLSAARMAYVAGLVLALELSFGLNGLLYPWLHDYVLPYRGLRVPARMAILVGFSLAILAGYGTARLCRVLQGRRLASIGVMVAIVSVLYVEYRSRLSVEDVWRVPPPIYDQLPDNPNTVVVNLPMIRPDLAYEPAYMYFSTFRWHMLANGYSGFSPPSYMELVDAMATFPDPKSVAELRRRGVQYVIVHGAFMKPHEYESLLPKLEASRDLESISAVRWQNRQTRLYRLLR
jgi:Dolichyl-phosphate-mannose-protein mannosyltransferase